MCCAYHWAEWCPALLIFSMPWVSPPLSSVCSCRALYWNDWNRLCLGAAACQPDILSSVYCIHSATFTWHGWLSHLCFTAAFLDQPDAPVFVWMVFTYTSSDFFWNACCHVLSVVILSLAGVSNKSTSDQLWIWVNEINLTHNISSACTQVCDSIQFISITKEEWRTWVNTRWRQPPVWTHLNQLTQYAN